MRAFLTTAALFAIGASGSLLVPAARAADNPNAAQIIQQLTPTPGGEMRTRGIRMGGEASKSAGGEAMRPAKAPESNLNVPFASGSAEISPAAASVLDQLGQALTSPNLAGFKFRVEGHTDTTGAADMNKALSEQRAMAVTDYLATNFNIDRTRLTPVGMGEDGLLVETGPGVANAANRRVLVVNLGN
jgi:outer membrane protein OmpA-like peptidoglycan-associated protein